MNIVGTTSRYELNKRKEVARIINKILKSYKNIDLKVNANDFIFKKTNKYIKWQPKVLESDGFFNITLGGPRDKFKEYLVSLITNRKKDYGIYYHFFKDFKYAKTALIKNEIQLSSLNSYYKNDPHEYYEFVKRYVNIVNFNNDFFTKYKDKLFIFCLTDSFRSQFMWQNYGENEKGVVFGLRFFKFTEERGLNDYFHLRNVVYDDGYDFDFLNEIQLTLFKKFKKELWFDEFTLFPIFYKRRKFKFENEIRLCIDYNFYINRKNIYNTWKKKLPENFNLENKHPIFHDKNRNYIKLHFKNNDFFEIQISDIICGKNITDDQFNDLKSLKNKETLLWKTKA